MTRTGQGDRAEPARRGDGGGHCGGHCVELVAARRAGGVGGVGAVGAAAGEIEEEATDSITLCTVVYRNVVYRPFI